VTDKFAPTWWTLADAEGNEADVCTWQAQATARTNVADVLHSE
jgi:hypothetical protein